MASGADWWKKFSSPQMVGAEGKNPAYNYTPKTITTMGSNTMHPSHGGAMGTKEVEMWEKELDREWLSDAFQSAIPGAPTLPSAPSAPSGAGQPGDPRKKRRIA